VLAGFLAYHHHMTENHDESPLTLLNLEGGRHHEVVPPHLIG
jgi:hypothetical protein